MTNALLHMSTLLRSGLGPEAVWSAIDSEAARTVTRLVRRGIPLQQAIAGLGEAGEWAVIADVWMHATQTGVPRADLCERIGMALDEVQQLRRQVHTAKASTMMSVRILAALPPVGLAGGTVLGLDMVGFLWGTGIGAICAGAGVGLAFAGWRWMSRIVALVPMVGITAGLLCDVAAHTARAGIGTASVVSSVNHLANRWDSAAELDIVRKVVESSRHTGLPIASALAAWANSLRRSASDAAQLAIEQVPGRLVVPVGVCLFPAFVLLVVVPAIAAMAGRSLGG